ncbi:MAG: HAMP domain-containing histidine kinase [Lachnospiraceae bacterium]|jgi:signal transduction histidine kinase|nr:HAMP domain-containing histidine kinase [Lachnospiraceae bacterium]MCI9099418.1 HAMP domain-containing histidine kinase [Lachnospiraceae bacterium]MCI9357422.1 HAMP domain-containing histidine kinase [Lachnospiraceae bacterium]
MKSVPKLIRRFVGIMTLSIILLVILNITFFAIVFVRNTSTFSPWDMADHAAAALQLTDGGYSLSDNVMAKLKEENAWALLIDNDTRQVVWQTDNLPANIPMQYTLSDVAELTRGYVNGYPAFTGEAQTGLLVLGYPKDRFWKHTRASWDYNFIADLPKNTIIIFAINIVLILLIYAAVNSKLLRSIKPITNGIQNLSNGIPVYMKEKGVLSELAEKINKTSEILQMQSEQLRRKETARANWIAGVSHDVRTPLSMIMGYAGQLENSKNLSEIECKKAAAIVKQSSRMKDLINDLNLASKLEYDMQPLTMKQENAISIIRQVIVDFMNTNIDDKFPIKWITNDTLSACYINADKDLLKRAISNLIQNSINHNENGCAIYASVCDNNNTCKICIEDNGIGASDEQIDRLNNTPHYMICDTNTAEQRHGLGLLIVKQIIKGHNGEIFIDHSEYGGFKVVLIIPK